MKDDETMGRLISTIFVEETIRLSIKQEVGILHTTVESVQLSQALSKFNRKNSASKNRRLRDIIHYYFRMKWHNERDLHDR